MDQIVLKNVTKRFETKTLGTITAVNDVSLNIKKGEVFAMLGPSGCGKTTTLRMIAGFENLSEGEIYIGGDPFSLKEEELYIEPEDRDLGMVFQAFAVWPHLNVFDNVAFPLQIQKLPRNEIRERVKVALEQTNLDGLEKVFPSDLSGGQQQRIALARAIIVNPGVLLLDEPLSNLDPKLRENMRFEIKRLQEEFNFTIIYVTHDQSEALAISDRILVMDKGKIIQIDTPEDIYNNPINRFVHNFLGESNFLTTYLKDGKVFIEGDDEQAVEANIENIQDGMIMASRPSEIGMNDEKGYRVLVQRRNVLPSFTEYWITVGTQTIKVQTPHSIVFEKGEYCYLNFKNISWYDKNDEKIE